MNTTLPQTSNTAMNHRAAPAIPAAMPVDRLAASTANGDAAALGLVPVAIEAADLAVDCIEPDPNNVRGFDPTDDLSDLTGSIVEQGMLQPIRVRPADKPGRYVIIAGERRWRAEKALGKMIIAAVIDRRELNKLQIKFAELAENLNRKDIRPMQLARVFQALHVGDGLTLEQIAAAVHRPLCFVSRKVSLLRFSAQVQLAIDDGRLEESTGVEIAKLKNEQDREAIADRAIREKLTREPVKALIARKARRSKARPASRPIKRVLCPLPGGASVAITCADTIPQLTTEEVIFALEFVLKEIRKAIRKQTPVAELTEYFRGLKGSAPAGANPEKEMT